MTSGTSYPRNGRSPASRENSAGGVLAALADPGGLTAQLAQVVELGPADLAAGHGLDLVDRRAVHREGALDAHAVADLPHREGLADAPGLTPDDHALEDLDTGAVTLLDPDVDPQRVPGAEVRNVIPELGLLEFGNSGVHDSDSSVFIGTGSSDQY